MTLNRRLEELGEPWRVRWANDPERAAPIVEIALEDLGLGPRLVLVDLEHPELAPVGDRADRPASAAFTLVDLLLRRLSLQDRARARVLAAFARRAIGEAP